MAGHPVVSDAPGEQPGLNVLAAALALRGSEPSGRLSALPLPRARLGRLGLALTPDDCQPFGQDLLEVSHAAALH